jgi:hypothetical protein
MIIEIVCEDLLSRAHNFAQSGHGIRLAMFLYATLSVDWYQRSHTLEELAAPPGGADVIMYVVDRRPVGQLLRPFVACMESSYRLMIDMMLMHAY